jgi:hypothetical protein
MKAIIRRLFYQIFPRTAARVFAIRARAYSQELARSWGCLQFNEKIFRQYGNKVLAGPFSGLKLSPEAGREHLAPYFFGTYEHELHKVWESVFQMRFDQLLDVGAKFGFYAVGLAKHFPRVPVVAFDTDPWARKATREMSLANDVSVQVLGYCSPNWLRDNLLKNAFIISDCEGYEAKLFGSEEISNLASATMLIEIHEQFSPGVTRQIHGKFSTTHTIQTISAQSEGFTLPPELASLTEAERTMAVSEYRTGHQSWVFLLPKAKQ